VSASNVPRVAVWAGALAGSLSAAVAVATSELIAGLVPGAPSLVIAMGSLAIALQPPGAKDVMTSLFGTNDKAALNVMVVAAVVAIAAGAGALAARRYRAGASIFVLFGVVAAVAAAAQPLAASVPAVATAGIATVAGLATLSLLLDLAPRSPAPAPTAATPEATPADAPSAPANEGPEWTRRRFLIASAVTLGGVAVAGTLGRARLDAQHPAGVVSTTKLPAPLVPVALLTADQVLNAPGLSPLVVPNDRFYRIDTALEVPQVDVSSWHLDVKGMVDHPLTFTYDQLLAMPLHEQYVTIACVSNTVGGPLVGNTLWTGVRLKDVLAQAGVQQGATQIVGRSVDGFTVGFPTAWATAPEREPLIAVGMNRVPLPADHGFPARLIVPGLYGYVSATKWLSSIELTTREAVDGYWVPLGWAKDAPILTQSRIDYPAGGQQLSPGPVQIAGVAWAPDRGVSRVEVNLDGGAWQPATMSRPISNATWVQWLLPWTASTGQHTIEVRATDESGTVQTAQLSDPAPDGARGHHRITVIVG
jgi:DMSO/TMAO reductase YedYZ molybdopterin-dependent catalytic subunit